MNVKILKSLLIGCGVLIFSGCAEKIVYVDRPIEVEIPQKCIIPDVHCNFNKETDTEVINAMLMCIEDFKKASEVCK